jgi:hypothetical protein
VAGGVASLVPGGQCVSCKRAKWIDFDNADQSFQRFLMSASKFCGKEFGAGLPDFLFITPKRRKIYQIVTKLPNGHNICTNGRNIFRRAIEYTYQLFSFQGPRKFTQIWIFGSIKYHLATLVWGEARFLSGYENLGRNRTCDLQQQHHFCVLTEMMRAYLICLYTFFIL